MKRILFLLLITSAACADVITDLENAIMKSNQEAVEALLAGKISITRDEQIALINLATEIIKKRENKIFINNSRTNIFFANDCLKSIDTYNRPIHWEKYLKNNAALNSYKIRGRIFAITALISCLTIGVTGPVGLILTVISIPPLFYYLIKCTNQRKKVILEHASHLNARYNKAIQIRQLLYKIKATPS